VVLDWMRFYAAFDLPRLVLKMYATKTTTTLRINSNRNKSNSKTGRPPLTKAMPLVTQAIRSPTPTPRKYALLLSHLPQRDLLLFSRLSSPILPTSLLGRK
jgi:hypothetical protein